MINERVLERQIEKIKSGQADTELDKSPTQRKRKAFLDLLLDLKDTQQIRSGPNNLVFLTIYIVSNIW